jgi:hypothetical protein
MITREQAIQLTHGTEIHYGECERKVGPRGGVKLLIEVWRVSGKCQTWKTRPNDFRLPIKHGMYQNDAIAQWNCDAFHLASECPTRLTLNESETKKQE